MEQQEFYKAAIYCRLSQDDGQQGDSSSIQTQKAMLSKFAEEQGFYIHDTYIDDGYSGLNFNRPDFQRLLNDIDDKKVNLIITKDLSRLGRDYIQTGYYTEVYFSERKVRYIALNDNVDTIRQDNDIAPFKNILNDMYARDLSRKVRTAKRQLMHKGYFICGQTPYGYKKHPNNHNKLIIDEQPAEIVKEIFRLAIDGMGYVKIAKALTQRQITIPSEYKANNGDTRFSRYTDWQRQNGQFKWCRATVYSILRDRVYAGDMVNGKYHIPNYKTKRRVKSSEDKLVIVENTHEPIVSREDYFRVQEIMKARHYPPKRQYENLFKSIVFCGVCGKRLSITHQKGKEFYRCNNHFLNPEQCERNQQIHYLALKDIVTERLKKLCLNFKFDANFFDNIVNGAKKSVKTEKLIAEKTKHEKRLATLKRITMKLYEDYASGELDNDSYTAFLREYQQEQKQINEQIAVIGKKLNSENDQAENLKRLMEIIHKFVNFTELTPTMINQLIERIDIKRANDKPYDRQLEISIVYRFVGTAI